MLLQVRQVAEENGVDVSNQIRELEERAKQVGARGCPQHLMWVLVQHTLVPPPAALTTLVVDAVAAAAAALGMELVHTQVAPKATAVAVLAGRQASAREAPAPQCWASPPMRAILPMHCLPPGAGGGPWLGGNCARQLPLPFGPGLVPEPLALPLPCALALVL